MNAKTNNPVKPTGRLLLGGAIAALMSAGGAAQAEQVSLTVEHTCPLPLIGDQTLTSDISADLPAEVTVNEPTGDLTINAVTTVPEDARQGISLVGGASIEGTATASNNIALSSGDMPLSAALEIPQQPVPGESGAFQLDASGTVDSLTFGPDDVGEGVITVGDLELDMVVRDANGNIAQDPVGEFVSDCTLNGNMEDMVLHTFDVIPDTPDANITVDPESIDFGQVVLNNQATETVTVGNNGGQALGINNVTIQGADAGAFTQTNDCTTLEQGQNCGVEVTYMPSGDQPQSATLVIDSTDPDDSPSEIPLSGEPTDQPQPGIGLDPQDSVNFGTLDLADNDSAQEDVVITNNGDQGTTLSINSIEVVGDNSTFMQTNNCPAGLNTGDQCTVSLTFQPGTPGDNYSADLEVGTNLDDSPSVLSLSGEAVDSSDNDGGNGGGGTAEVLFDIEGTTNVAATDTDVPLTGQIDTELVLQSGEFTGDLQLDPTQAQFAISKLFSKIQGRADIEFETVGETTGTLEDGQLTAESQVYIEVPEARVSLISFWFGSDGIRIGGGEECRTEEPVTINLENAEGTEFDPLGGGTVVGTFEAPPLENCGALTDLLNQFIAGPGNTIELELSQQQ